jgi:hypothetical protein
LRATPTWVHSLLGEGALTGSAVVLAYQKYLLSGTPEPEKGIDSDTGLTYHWNRWGNKECSVFISGGQALYGLNWYGYAWNNQFVFTDPLGLFVNFAVGAAIGFVTSSATEVGSRMIAGQSLTEALVNTVNDPTSLAIIGASTVIGCATSGLSGLAVESIAKTAATATLRTAPTVASTALKTVITNTISGAVDAVAKDSTINAITGKQTTVAGTIESAAKGATSALVASGASQALIGYGSARYSEPDLSTGKLNNVEIKQPKWAGSVGVMGESVIPATYDTVKAIHNSKSLKGK